MARGPGLAHCGTPDVPSVVANDSVFESYEKPHLHLDHEQRMLLDEETERDEQRAVPHPPPVADDRAPPRLRVTRKLLKTRLFNRVSGMHGYRRGQA